jgi:hypothetical protein
MTALPVSGVRASIPAPSHSLATGLLSAFRKAAARINAVEKVPARTARGNAAAMANPLMRDHASMTIAL